MNETDNSEKYQPPLAPRVAARAQVLSAQAYRAFLERDVRNPEVGAAHAECIAWCQEAGLESEFEPREWTLLTTPVGKLSKTDEEKAGWLTEAAACMAWALGGVETLDYETQVDGGHVSALLHFLEDSAQDFRMHAQLRPSVELKQFRDTYLTIRWRLREFSLRPTPLDFARFAKECKWANMRLDRVRLVDKDLSIDGKALATAAEASWRNCLSIASERHRAAEWLLGQHPTYSEITADR